MNKQKAIELLQDVAQRVFHRTGSRSVHIDKIVELVNQIDEPQKVVVPQFVAEWIESKKEYFSDSSAIYMYDNLTLGNNGGYYHDVWLWAVAHHHDFIKAWHDGYDVEKEPLYTVEIPDPNSYVYYRHLSRNDNGICIDASNDAKWKQKKRNKFTESEIKQDFEWAWKWAKEVGDDTEV